MSLHPAVARVRLAVRRTLADVEPGQAVLVACSGGADSLALLAATCFEGHGAGWQVVGVTIDHGLQPGSAQRAEQLLAQMSGLGAHDVIARRVVVESSSTGPEAAARTARYAALTAVAAESGAVAVLLGHTRDDQAETVLLGLTRGSGGRSLAGMRPAFDHYRRPLLELPRADTVAACEAEGIDYWQDPHNEDGAFTRARVRHRVLPLLEDELGPGISSTLARTAEQLRDDTELLDQWADRALAGLARDREGGVAVSDLAEQPAAIRRRVLRLLALAAGAPAADLCHEHVLALDALVTDWHGQRWIDLPGHLRGMRRADRIVFVADPVPAQ